MSLHPSKGFVDPTSLRSEVFRCEYLVIGSGAGGSVAALELAEAGKDVVVLEEGEHCGTKDMNNKVGEMTSRLYRRGGIFPILGRPTIAFGEGRCVGGGTVINGGLIWRPPKWILAEWAEKLKLGSYRPDRLDRHSERIEELLSVSPPKEGDHDRDSTVLKQACQVLGWNYVLGPRAVRDCQNANLCPTGCPTGAKQAMHLTYLPRSIQHGARILTQCRVVRVVRRGGAVRHVICDLLTTQGKRRLKVIADHFIFSGGSIQTPYLLAKSGIGSRLGMRFGFHMNMKFVATFKQRINASNGTIFTGQVQEFAQQGMLFAACNWQPGYIATALAHHGNDTINRVMERSEHSALYVALLRPKSRGRILSLSKEDPILTYRFDPADLPLLKNACRKLVQLLFVAGADTVYLPIAGASAVSEEQQLEGILSKAKPRDFEILSVHVMGACPLGDPRSIVDQQARINGLSNAMICDASILPTNIGESPQGTIMAFAHEVMQRHLDSI